MKILSVLLLITLVISIVLITTGNQIPGFVLLGIVGILCLLLVRSIHKLVMKNFRLLHSEIKNIPRKNYYVPDLPDFLKPEMEILNTTNKKLQKIL